MAESLRTNPSYRVQFINVPNYEASRKAKHSGLTTPQYHSFSCRESYSYRNFDNFSQLENLWLMFHFSNPKSPVYQDKEKIVAVIRLLDSFVGMMGIYIAPKEIVKKAPVTKAGDFTIDEGKAITYRGIAPSVFNWYIASHSLLTGALRTALAVFQNEQLRELFLTDKMLSFLSVKAINEKDKDTAKAAAARLKKLILENVHPSSYVLTRNAHWELVETLRNGWVEASDKESKLNWTRDARNRINASDINGIYSYGRWLRYNKKAYEGKKIKTFWRE